MKRLVLVLILIASFCGMADSAYIAKNEAANTPLECNFSHLSGCNIVAQSSYAELFGIPVANYGFAFFGLLFALAAVDLALNRRFVRRAIQTLAALGLIASAYFVFVQMELINALCIYCLLSAGLSFLIFIFAYFVEPFREHQTIEADALEAENSFMLPPS